MRGRCCVLSKHYWEASLLKQTQIGGMFKAKRYRFDTCCKKYVRPKLSTHLRFNNWVLVPEGGRGDVSPKPHKRQKIIPPNKFFLNKLWNLKYILNRIQLHFWNNSHINASWRFLFISPPPCVLCPVPVAWSESEKSIREGVSMKMYGPAVKYPLLE